MQSPPRRGALSIFLLLLVLLLVWRPPQLLDYSAFLCAGQNLRLGIDPYSKVGATFVCEQQIVALTGARLSAGELLPAPFPPYVLAFFAVWSLLPKVAGAALWIIALVAGYLVLVEMLRRLSGQSPAVVVGVTLIPVLWGSLAVGELTSLAVGAIVACAAAFRAGRLGAAVCAALAALCEPHLGLPVALSLFCCSRAARIPLLLGGASLMLLSCAVAPPRETWEYLFQVLPAHARAELYADSQVSLSHAAALLGLPPPLAEAIGLAQYCAMTLLGVLCSVRLARNARDRDLAVLAPAALAVFGGSFVHIQQIAIAACCALLLVRASSGRFWGKLLDLSLVLFATPIIFARSTEDVIAYALIAFVITFGRGYSLLRAVPAAAVVVITMTFVYQGMAGRLPGLHPLSDVDFVPKYAYGADADIESVWRAYLAARSSWLGPVSLLAQAPTFLALAILSSALCMYARAGATAERARRVLGDAERA
jgi:hypothetical protein